MLRRFVLFIASMACLTLVLSGVAVAAPPDYSAGEPGVGDPYYPLAGNGGYDVDHYDLDLTYEPETDVLSGTATIRATATQDLSSFNLDLDGLEVQSVTIDGRAATWTRADGELTITPARGIRRNSRFAVVIEYEGVPDTIEDQFGLSGFIHTDDGALIAGQPEVAATWYPVNDHPSDKASYTFHITVPEGLEAVANGKLTSQTTRNGYTTWTWKAKEPMASYLTTATIGEFELRDYRTDGIRYWDAFDPDLFEAPEPRTGEQFLLSQAASLTYKRLTRTIAVPDDGATLSFWVNHDIETNWDFMFVEAHTVGDTDWTTLPDVNGATTQNTGNNSCAFWLSLHPFLSNYQSGDGNDSCAPEGSGDGEWWAVTGASDGWEQWTVDLQAYAGETVEVSISYASDDIIQGTGVYIDDIEVSTGEGSTSFEDDGDTLDGWTVAGSPEGSEPNENDWIVGTAEDVPPSIGEIAQGSLDRQPEIITFLEDLYGPYPFKYAGGIVDDAEIFFALENQTRPVYSYLFFSDSQSGDAVVVHELAHQWFGDSLALDGWQHIWLNEGFATYSEWLWAEYEGFATAQEIFDSLAGIPADNSFWNLTIGDPGPDNLFDGAVYDRGAMTLHALRLEIGDDAFFELVRTWPESQEGGTVTTDEFIALAEDISGQQLDEFFDIWLFTPEKPATLGAAGAEAAAASSGFAAQAPGANGAEASSSVGGATLRRQRHLLP